MHVHSSDVQIRASQTRIRIHLFPRIRIHPFLSPPVQVARWAPMRRFPSVCDKNSYYIISHSWKGILPVNIEFFVNIGKGLLLWQCGLIANVKLHFFLNVNPWAQPVKAGWTKNESTPGMTPIPESESPIFDAKSFSAPPNQYKATRCTTCIHEVVHSQI